MHLEKTTTASRCKDGNMTALKVLVRNLTTWEEKGMEIDS